MCLGRAWAGSMIDGRCLGIPESLMSERASKGRSFIIWCVQAWHSPQSWKRYALFIFCFIVLKKDTTYNHSKKNIEEQHDGRRTRHTARHSLLFALLRSLETRYLHIYHMYNLAVSILFVATYHIPATFQQNNETHNLRGAP